MKAFMPLVSLISPCYNGENYLVPFLESVLKQSYNNIEFIFINDGSNDKTEEILFGYRDRFKAKKIKLIYIYQENGGVAKAVNAGLKVFSGKYITWSDSDDILRYDCIEKKVSFLEKNMDKAFVTCKVANISENNLDRVLRVFGSRELENRWIFEDLIKQNGIVSVNGGAYMVRSESLLDVLPTRHIFDGNSGGQNWQLLLPLSYKYRCGYIDEILFYCVVRRDSHSHKNPVDYKNSIEKMNKYKQIMRITIESINMDSKDRHKYENMVTDKYTEEKMSIALKYRLIDEINKCYYEYKKNGGKSIHVKVSYYLCRYSIVRKIYSFYKRFFKKIRTN